MPKKGPAVHTTTLRVPLDVWERIEAVAQEEERPLTTQIMRLLRAGLAQYDAQQQASGIRRLA